MSENGGLTTKLVMNLGNRGLNLFFGYQILPYTP